MKSKIWNWNSKIWNLPSETWNPTPDRCKLKPETWTLKCKISETWNPKSEIWILKSKMPETWNLKSEIWYPESKNWNLQSEIWNLKSGIWNLKPATWDLKNELAWPKKLKIPTQVTKKPSEGHAGIIPENVFSPPSPFSPHEALAIGSGQVCMLQCDAPVGTGHGMHEWQDILLEFFRNDVEERKKAEEQKSYFLAPEGKKKPTPMNKLQRAPNWSGARPAICRVLLKLGWLGWSS